ncbi:peptide chain release factor 1, mitochondrial isoform X3 [Cavia porcellus]|uniref:peptide chain release factor 1, mitochondrial isoform X3 n=1 Tax=Cavia porcellus TaxID=10141 RepID=UPI002FE31D15
MNRHLCIWLFRHPPLNAYPRCHIYLHSHQFKQLHLKTRLWLLGQNRNHILHCFLNNNWSRRCCHQDTRMIWKHKAFQKYMEDLSKEYQTLGRCLQDVPVNEADRKCMTRRHAELSPLAAIYQEIQDAEQAIKELESMCKSLNEQDEKQLQELALEERHNIYQKINTLYSELFQSLLPKEKYDKNDVILEVTSGRTTGGDICQQFTREIFDMYQNYSCYKHWKFELLNYTPADYGGLHHAAARISGENVYKHLKYEGGIHRVQRIPEVGLSSRMQRIHTGTMSVIVLPQPDEVAAPGGLEHSISRGRCKSGPQGFAHRYISSQRSRRAACEYHRQCCSACPYPHRWEPEPSQREFGRIISPRIESLTTG